MSNDVLDYGNFDATQYPTDDVTSSTPTPMQTPGSPQTTTSNLDGQGITPNPGAPPLPTTSDNVPNKIPNEPTGQPPFWKTLLMGAINGLAGARGATKFGGGLTGGAAGELTQEQNQFNNNQTVRFANLQDAKQAADLTRQMTAEQHWGEQQKTANDQLALSKATFFRNAGYKVTPLDRSPDAVTTFLSTNGGNVHPYTFNDSDTIFAVTPGEDGGWKGYNDLAKAIGGASISQDAWGQMKPQQRFLNEKTLNDRLGKMSSDEIKTALSNYSKTSEQNPDIIDQLNKQAALSDAHDKHSNDQKDLQAQRTVNTRVAVKNATGTGGAPGEWKPKVTADEKKKAELAENIAENANAVNDILSRRPDLVGAVAGRFTNAQQMIGNDDADISALGMRMHNIAMANSGVHGMRSKEGVQKTEEGLLNNFKNGPNAVRGALNASTDSVQTFVDNARPEGYQTHSSKGGASGYYATKSLPAGNGQKLDANTAKAFYAAAGGDPNKARQLAGQKGWTF